MARINAARVWSLLTAAQLATASLYPGLTPDNHTCQIENPVVSCSRDANPDCVDTCCSETYGGLLLQTQFWSTYTGLEAQGQYLPKDTWTIHGLWPDFCNGSYTQYCDLSRQYDPDPSPKTTNGEPNGTPVPPYKGAPISDWFEPYGKLDLLAYMNKYWVNQGAPNWEFWAHEFSKHATCYSTFQTDCFGPKAAEYDDVFIFFETVITWWRDLPTWDWLAYSGIRPSNATTYSLSHIQHAIKKQYGHLPYLGCGGPKYNETAAGKGTMDDGRTELSQVFYYHHVLGRPQDHHVIRLDAAVGGSVSNCATSKDAIWYYEATESSVKA